MASEATKVATDMIGPGLGYDGDREKNIEAIKREMARPGLDPAIRAMYATELGNLQNPSMPGGGRGFVNPPSVDITELGGVMMGAGDPNKKTSTTLSGRVYPVSQEAMAKRMEDFTAGNAALKAILEAQVGKTQATSEQVANAITDEGAVKAKATTIAGEIEAARQQGATDIAQFFKATLGPQDAMVNAEAKRQQAQYTMDTLKPTIDAADAVRIYDNPMEWLINQLTVPQMKTTYNAALKTQNQQTAFIRTTQQLVEAQKALDLSITGAQLREKAAAMAQAETFSAVVKANAARAAGIHQVSQIVMQQAALQNMEMNTWEQYLRMTAQALSMHEVAKEDLKWQPTVDKINAQRSYVGLPPIEVSQFKAMNAAERDYLAKQSALPPGTIGADMGDSFLYLANSGGLNTILDKNPLPAKTLSTQMASDKFRSYMAVMIEKNPRMQQMSPEEQRAKALTSFNQEEVADLHAKRQYDKLEDSSPRKVRIGNAIQYPDLAANSFTPEVKRILAEGDFRTEVKPKDLETVAAARAINEPGKIKQIAKDLSDFYRDTQTQQWVKTGAAALGVGRPQEFGTTSMTVNGKPVNQWNPVEVERWLMMQVTGSVMNPGVMMTPGQEPQLVPGLPAVQQQPFDKRFTPKP